MSVTRLERVTEMQAWFRSLAGRRRALRDDPATLQPGSARRTRAVGGDTGATMEQVCARLAKAASSRGDRPTPLARTHPDPRHWSARELVGVRAACSDLLGQVGRHWISFWIHGLSSGNSSVSDTRRTSSLTPLPSGTFCAHCLASSFDDTSRIQKPLNSSLASVYGPSVTTGGSELKSTTKPSSGPVRPSPASSTPALMSSSLKRPIDSMISLKSMLASSMAASASGVDRMISM